MMAWRPRFLPIPAQRGILKSCALQILNDGFVFPPKVQFTWEMAIQKVGFTTHAESSSDDPVRDLSQPSFFGDSELFGFKTPPRALTFDIAFLEPGEQVIFSYSVETLTDTGGPTEVGMQALFGDPLNFNAPGAAFSFSFSPVSDGIPGPGPGPGSPVPQPGSLVLVAVGLVGLSWHRLHLPRCARASRQSEELR
jgi:hypothetical protein